MGCEFVTGGGGMPGGRGVTSSGHSHCMGLNSQATGPQGGEGGVLGLKKNKEFQWYRGTD